MIVKWKREEEERESGQRMLFVASQKGKREGRVNGCRPRPSKSGN